MSEKIITVLLNAPVRLTCVASDETGEVRIKKIMHIDPPCVDDLMDGCSDDDLTEIDQAFENSP